MNIRVFFLAIVCTGLVDARPACAQQPSAAPPQSGDVEALKHQMLEMQAGLKQMQNQHQREVSALRAEVESLRRVIDDLRKPVSTGGEGLFPTTDESVVAPTVPHGAPSAATAAAAVLPALAGNGGTALVATVFCMLSMTLCRLSTWALRAETSL